MKNNSEYNLLSIFCYEFFLNEKKIFSQKMPTNTCGKNGRMEGHHPASS